MLKEYQEKGVMVSLNCLPDTVGPARAEGRNEMIEKKGSRTSASR